MSINYNTEAAELLAHEALGLPISDAVPIYEQLLSTFPTAAKYWKQYVEAHMSVNNDDATKQIFNRCLLNCWQVPLWGCYIRFIRKVNDRRGIEGQEETRKAFEFMLGYVGADIASGPVWIEYIAFLKSLPAQTPQEESQRMTMIRKTYQRAIVTPTHHVEQLWREYENFENSVSRALAKGLISEYQPKYNSARAVYRERKKFFDEIDWNMLAVPPSGSSKEEMQWTAWKKLLAFEKGNPQRMDSVSANKRIEFTYEQVKCPKEFYQLQCLMFLYHYPDVWYNYVSWYAKAGSTDSAIKVFMRAIKALPDSEMLKYAYAELEESRGAIQAAKKVYESLLGDGSNPNALSQIQYIRFLRRTEGVEAARKYFLDARKSPTCTYHVYVAYAMMVFCLDKDAKIAHNVFEAGLKHFMHEPGYILEYADFLCRMNDDRNVRALFERALSTLPPEESVEVWKRFAQFEQTYGDLSSMMKVEQRKREALSRTGDEGELALESSLQDVVSRYSFMDLWPCSSKDLDYLARKEWLSKNLNKKSEKPIPAEGSGQKGNLAKPPSSKLVHPDFSKMVLYDRHEKLGPVGLLPVSTAAPLAGPAINGGFIPTVSDDIFKTLPPALVAFASNLPSVDGPSPDVDFVISICLQSNIPTLSGKGALPSTKLPGGSGSTTNERVNKHKVTRDRQHGKRKGQGQDDDESLSVQSQPLPRDVFKIRQMQKARASSSYTGSASYGSAFSGELSGSTG